MMIHNICRKIVICLKLIPIALFALTMLPLQMIAVWLKCPQSGLIPMWFHRVVCFFLNIRISCHGTFPNTRPLLVVANHTSWLDISVIGSQIPLSFIAKSDVVSWPIIGLFAKLQRTIFIDRSRRTKTGIMTGEIGTRMAENDVIVLFPEGTSNDGNRILPFRSALFGAIHSAMKTSGQDTIQVQPMAISYTHRNGLPLTRIDQPSIAWYGDMDLIPHLLDIIAGGPIDVQLTFCTPYITDALTDRKSLAKISEHHVRTAHREVRS